MEKYLAPEPIGEGELSDLWRRFKREFTLFLMAIGKDGATEQTKLAVFLRSVGPRVNDMYETLRFEEGKDRMKWSVVSGKLDNACARRTSKHVTRDKFIQLQQGSKSVDQFVVELRKQVRDCAFGELQDDLILHVLIRGVSNERMRRRLLETENLDLPKAIRMCQTMEATAADLQSLVEKTETVEKIAAMESQSTRGGKDQFSHWRKKQQDSVDGKARQPRQQRNAASRGAKVCSRCGRLHQPRQCPAYGQQCTNCGAPNHFAHMCTRRTGTTHLVEKSPTPPASEEKVMLIRVQKVGRKLLAKVPFQREKKIQVITCQLDTAASCNVMSLTDYQLLGNLPRKQSKTTLTMYDGSVSRSLGKCMACVQNRQGKLTKLEFEILETKHHTLLSLDTCLNLQLLSYKAECVCLAEAGEGLTKERVVEDYTDVFSGTGCLAGEYNIPVDRAIPAVQNRPRRIPLTMKTAVEEKLKAMEKDRWITRVDTPTEWISNLTAIWKADKAQVRVCLDPRDLNTAIKRSHFQMPTMDDVLPLLRGAKIFSLLDASKTGLCTFV